jgi:aminopeptidase N
MKTPHSERHIQNEHRRIDRPGRRPLRRRHGHRRPYVPGHGTDAYRVLHYELELDYRLASNRLTGRAVLAAVAARRTSAVVLDMTGLRALKVQLNGTRVRKFTQRAEQLVVHCEQPLEAGSEFSLEIRYDGNPQPRRGLWGEVGWEELTDGVLVAGQPNGAPSWFPCNDHPRNKASYRITVTTDAGYRVVCNGLLVGHAMKSSRQTWVYEQSEPMATYLATIQIGRYGLVRLPDSAAFPSSSRHRPNWRPRLGPRWPGRKR